jgi:dTDP-4-amino-4,6-dideoxygalactose transaminase
MVDRFERRFAEELEVQHCIATPGCNPALHMLAAAMDFEPGCAFRMPFCTAAICLGQLEIIHEQVAQRDRMIRLMSKLIDEIPGVTPLPIPEFVDVYSAWMFTMSIDPAQFTCTVDEFARQLVDAGVPNAGSGRYHLMPVACTFLNENAANSVYPYSMPPASRRYRYDESTCPTAWDFVQSWIRWATFCEKYTKEDCYRAQEIVARVANRNRK